MAAEGDQKRVEGREDLMRLIADASQRSVTYLDNEKALALADSILRSMKEAGLKIARRE